MAEVALRQVVKKFGEVEAVRSIDLDIPDNEFVVLVGPSGCGKSTTLRMIAGLEASASSMPPVSWTLQSFSTGGPRHCPAANASA